jgi:Secretion system C-terminal sorting domain
MSFYCKNYQHNNFVLNILLHLAFNNYKFIKMKKSLLSMALLSTAICAMAQTKDVVKPQGNPTQGATRIPVSKSMNAKKTRGFGNNSIEIGRSFYDLQTNGSMSRRIVNHGSGSVSAIWTYSNENSTTFTDRGTGYNTSVAGVFGPAPTLRVEGFRTGFPCLSKLGTSEYYVNHNGNTAKTYGWKNSGAGSAFVQQAVTLQGVLPSDTFLWPKVAVNGNTIHVINSNSYTGDTNRIGLFYSRSTDGGLTWPINSIAFPGIDTADMYNLGGESYNISANGSNVAVIAGGLMTNLYLMRSSDNGTTWTKDTILDTGLPANRNPYSFQTIVAGGTAPQNIFSSDGSAAMTMGTDNVVHVTFSTAGGFIDSTLLAGGFYRPITFLNTLLYWNSNNVKNQFTVLDSLFDCDDNTTFDFGQNHNAPTTTTTKSDRYSTAGSSNMSQIAISGQNIYCVFSAVMDGDTTDSGDPSMQLSGQNFRDIFMVMSQDGGATWGARINISNSPKVEDVFPSIAENVDGKVHIMWQQDFEPGTVLQSADDQVDGNSFRYLGLTTTWLADHSAAADYTCRDVLFIPAAISNIDKNGKIIYNIYPNPATETLNISGDIANKTISITNAFGQVVNATIKTTNQFNAQANIAALPNGIYVVTITDAKGTVTQKFTKN